MLGGKLQTAISAAIDLPSAKFFRAVYEPIRRCKTLEKCNAPESCVGLEKSSQPSLATEREHQNPYL